MIAGTGTPILSGMAKELLLGIRPEDVTLGDSGIAARVQSAEFLGADTVITCTVGSQALTARVPGKASFGSGAAIHVDWRPERLHFFDAASGRRRDDAVTLAIKAQDSFVQNQLV